jgi:dephospho-CoA kinase
MLVGLTGGIGSGKSTIAAELARRGYPVYDTDREAKRIITHNPAVRSQVETLFGSDVFDGDTYLTTKVAAQVFANPDLRLKLNKIVHPAVRFDLEHWVKSNSAAGCFVECAILYESGLNELCDKVVYIDAPEDIRIARTVARDHCLPEQAKARIQAQSPDAKHLADLTLINDGTTPISTLADSLLHSFPTPYPITNNQSVSTSLS